MGSVAYAVVGDAALWEVVGAYLCTAVAGGDEGLAAVGNVIYILLMLFIINKGTQACERTFLILGLVASLGTLDEYLFGLAGIGVLPHVTQTHTGFHLVDVLSASSRRAESVPLYLALVDVHLKLVCLRQYGHGGGAGLHAAVALGDRHSLDAVYSRLIFQHAIHSVAADGKVYLLESAHSTFADAGDGEVPAFRLAELLIHGEEVAGKEASLVAASASADLHLHVLCVFWVFRHKGNLYLLFDFRL